LLRLDGRQAVDNVPACTAAGSGFWPASRAETLAAAVFEPLTGENPDAGPE